MPERHTLANAHRGDAAQVLTLPSAVVHDTMSHMVQVFVKGSADLGHCSTRWAGYRWEDSAGKTPVGVALCPPTGRSNRTRWVQPGAASVAMCIPGVYGAHITQEDVLRHHRYHRQLGVSHTFLYVANMSWRLPSSVRHVSVLYTPWVHDHRLHSRGQLWHINDCIHRAGRVGFAWTLNIDLDEWLYLLPRGRLHQSAPRDPIDPPSATLHGFLRRQPASVDVITLGSRTVSNWSTATLAGTRPKCTRWSSMLPHTVFGGIRDALGVSAAVCVGPQGHRKHLTRTNRIWACHVHVCEHCQRGPCVVSNMRNDAQFVYHMAGRALTKMMLDVWRVDADRGGKLGSNNRAAYPEMPLG